MKMKKTSGTRPSTLDKNAALEPFRERPEGTFLTSDQGIPIAQTDDSLKAGLRGPTLLEDFHLREKMTRFDHERIPERVVHARGAAAHGFFQVYEPLGKWTRAAFLNDPSVKTPVFVRFSTVGGSRGSADTVRDVRGFATKFYTSEGNFDLVGNNMPVFFIQDGIKFPDFVHSVKPEPDHEMPQASSAHDSFWDFVSLQPESMHMVMWLMSDRAIPRSFSMMEGFGVHTFRLVDERGRSRFCKFHWKPLKGMFSLAWDEAQKISGKDPDFHRRDLWEAIERGDFPEWELGLQIVEEKDEDKFAFDLLDPTKLIPEELVPVQRVGRMTLNRNPQNFFAETEQVAYCVSNLVSGIDVTNDPLMQARLFSYLDTQLTRLGGPNFATIPINRPVVPVHNHQQDGFHREVIPTGKANYFPNSIGGGCPFLATMGQGGYAHFPQPVEGTKVRKRAPSLADHFSQATLFLESLTPPERAHLTKACQFELGKVLRPEIRARAVEQFANIDLAFAKEVADALGLPAPRKAGNRAGPKPGRTVDHAPSLSMEATPNKPPPSIKGRKVAVLVADGFDAPSLQQAQAALTKAGALVETVAKMLGTVTGSDGKPLAVDKTYLTSGGSIMYDAVIACGGAKAARTLATHGDARHFINEAFKHCKPVGALPEGAALLEGSQIGIAADAASGAGKPGVVLARGVEGGRAFARAFIEAMGQHRFWEREADESVPA